MRWNVADATWSVITAAMGVGGPGKGRQKSKGSRRIPLCFKFRPLCKEVLCELLVDEEAVEVEAEAMDGNFNL